MTDQTLHIIDQLLAAWNSHDPHRVAAWYTEDCSVEDVAIAQPLTGREAVRRMFEAYYRAFPDLKLTASDIILDGDRVAVFWIARGTHHGSILHIPPSGRSISAQGVNRLVLQNGKVRESLTIWDVASMLRALSLLPDL